MEQHPVPQNVTTFQFRLIGDMTIKQFGYLAGGAILAYICYKLPLPFFFSWPLAFIFGLAGFGFAFVPVEERPMDVWVMSFLKNVYSPTQFIWTHEAPAPAPQPKLSSVATNQPPAPKPVASVLQRIYSPQATSGHVPQPKAARPDFFHWFTTFISSPRRPVAQTAAAPVPAANLATPSIIGNHLDLTPPPKVTQSPPKQAPRQPSEEAQVVKKQEELDQKAHDLQSALAENSQTNARILELQKQLMEVLAERDQMQKELAAVRAKTVQPPHAYSAPAPASQASAVATPGTPHQPSVRIITPETAVKAGLPRLTTFPNVVTGVIRDADNNLLPGVLVTVRDREGVPLRALKTNRLGQFAASTPIPNGTYLVEVEDPRMRYIFDRVQITLNGSIVPALEIFAKSHKQVAREKLAKEIFGS